MAGMQYFWAHRQKIAFDEASGEHTYAEPGAPADVSAWSPNALQGALAAKRIFMAPVTETDARQPARAGRG